MRSFFVKNILFVIVVNILIKPVWIFFIDRTVQNRVGFADYGTYQALLNLSLIFQIVLDMGLSYYNSNKISRGPRRLKVLFPVLFSARLLLSLIYAVIVFTTGYMLGFGSYELLLLAGIILIQALNSMLLFVRNNVAALQKFKTDALLSATDKFLMVIVCGVLLYIPFFSASFKIDWFVWAQITCYFITLIIAFVVLLRLQPLKNYLSIDRKLIGRIGRESLPYASLVFLMAVYTRSDSLLLVKLIGAESGKTEAGKYASAFRLLDVCNILGLLFSGVLLPLFGRMLAEKQSPVPIIRLCSNLLLPFSISISVASVLWGDSIMDLLYTHKSEDLGLIFGLVMCAFPCYCILYIYCTLLTANGSLKYLNTWAIITAVLNLGLNFYLLPRYGAAGAAVSALITQSFAALGFIIGVHKTLSFRANYKWIGSHVLFAGMTCLLGYALYTTRLNWLPAIGIFVILVILAMFLFRFIELSGIKKLFTRR